MEKAPINVGKNILESLTIGMYDNSQDIFREYIQNATDAIDRAVSEGIINRDDGRIDINVDPQKREIRIRDNGIGIPSDDVYRRLADIGNSQKDYKGDRGFRGVGRLGGLAYCREFEFVTSYAGENCKTIMHWNSDEFRRLLPPDTAQNMSVNDLIRDVTVLETKPESDNEHYFEVILYEVDKEQQNKLLDIEGIRTYLSQVAPVPFDDQYLSLLQKINEKLRELGREPEEYNIFLNGEQIYKPYRRKVHIKRGQEDFIKSIEFFWSKKNDGSLFFFGWYGVTWRDEMTGKENPLHGQIKDDDVSGIRLRKGNIQIGDNRILDSLFRESRFNTYFVGEIYVFDHNLIPNLRRDNFEEVPTYFELRKEIENTTRYKLSKLVRDSSIERSKERADEKINELPERLERILQELVSGTTVTRREKLSAELEEIKKEKNKLGVKKKPSKTKPIIPNVRIDSGKDDRNNLDKNNESVHISISSNTMEKIEQENTQVSEIRPDNLASDVCDDREKKENQLKQIIETLIEKVEDVIATTPARPTDEVLPIYGRDIKKALNIVFEVIDRVLAEDTAKSLREEIIEELNAKAKSKGKRKK